MIANIINVLVWGSIVAALVSCNIYAPLDSKSSDNDRIEAAQKCLHDGDYDCAIEQYNEIADSTEKAKRLCLVYLSQSGAGINSLVSTIQTNSVNMLGSLAQGLMPWNSTKSSAADSAVTQCSAYATAASGTQTAFLLKALGHLVRCATRMAKTDQTISANADNTCAPISGDNNGILSKNDIDSGANGMCNSDATTCRDDMEAVKLASDSLGSELGAIKSATSSVYTTGGFGAGLSDENSRTALRATIAN